MPDNPIEVAYDAFIGQVDHNLQSVGVSAALDAAITAQDTGAALAAVRDMARLACGTAKMLWLGSPVNTVLRNTKTNEMATRVITATEGIPLWIVTKPDGSKWDTHDPVLQPEADWVCIYTPAGAS